MAFVADLLNQQQLEILECRIPLLHLHQHYRLYIR